MNITKSLLVLAAMAIAEPAYSQRIVSPEVHSDGKITFRLKAPGGKEVCVQCEGVKSSAMQKDDQGVWSLTTEALEPDIYAYSFSVDGVRMIDPNNPLLKYNLLNTDSQVHVPGPKTLAWEINDVPRGQLHRHFYKSEIAGDERDFLVYTPPGYNAAAEQKYPVLYLLHGYSDDTTAWTSVGFAHVILDNLIARKQAKPMIVVMPLGYGTMEVVRGGWGGLAKQDLWKTNLEKFQDTLLKEVIPQVEKSYRVRTEASSRAIAGLSMGGTESLLTGLNNLDRFAWVGAFSSGGLGTNLPAQFPSLDAKANDRLRLLWIACGEQDGLITLNKGLIDWLKTRDIWHTWVPTPGQHSFRVWRRYLADFATLLFQERRQYGVGTPKNSSADTKKSLESK
jgi:enterochelin esterase family protein